MYSIDDVLKIVKTYQDKIEVTTENLASEFFFDLTQTVALLKEPLKKLVVERINDVVSKSQKISRKSHQLQLSAAQRLSSTSLNNVNVPLYMKETAEKLEALLKALCIFDITIIDNEIITSCIMGDTIVFKNYVTSPLNSLVEKLNDELMFHVRGFSLDETNLNDINYCTEIAVPRTKEYSFGENKTKDLVLLLKDFKDVLLDLEIFLHHDLSDYANKIVNTLDEIYLCAKQHVSVIAAEDDKLNRDNGNFNQGSYSNPKLCVRSTINILSMAGIVYSSLIQILVLIDVTEKIVKNIGNTVDLLLETSK